MNFPKTFWLAVVALAVFAGGALALAQYETTELGGLAEHDGNRMKLPADLDEWVFLGTSLGMGYTQRQFDPDNPGNFQLALMEPNAYRAFKESGEFADGTMFALVFRRAANRINPNRAGFVLGEFLQVEIHLKDAARFEPGYNFYLYGPGDEWADEVALDNGSNGCIDCHNENGAYDGVFVQFYPKLYDYLTDDARAAVDAKNRAGGHE